MWLRKWWWLPAGVLAIALIIGWKEERCESQAHQCRAAYEAQAQSERIGSNRLTVYQQAAEQRAIATACEPNGYFCRLFGAANLPNIGLLLAGIIGIAVAISTLKSISRQGDLLEKQITIPFRAYLAIGEPTHTANEQILSFGFPIRNYGHMAASITRISMEVIVQIPEHGGELFRSDVEREVNHTIPPERDDMFAIDVELPSSYRNDTCIVSGKITYDTGFKESDSFEFVRVFSGWYTKWAIASTHETFTFTGKQDTEPEKDPN
jgi:hypothetical protein